MPGTVALKTETVRVEEAAPPDASVTLVKLNDTVRPRGVEAESVTTPANPPRLASVILDVSDVPMARSTGESAETLKSTILRVNVAE